MNSKLLIFCAGLALAATASVPQQLSVEDLREAFETKEAVYIPISNEEAEFLRFPRSTANLGPSTWDHAPRSILTYIDVEDLKRMPQENTPSASSGGRFRRSADADGVIETEDAYYVPVTEDDIKDMLLVEEVPEPEVVENNDEIRMEILTDDEVLQENALSLAPATDDSTSNSRTKRQVFVQGGGGPRQGYDVYAQGRAKLWESDNKRNSVHGTAQYSQHLGGPYGNSKPNYGAGLQFTHRF